MNLKEGCTNAGMSQVEEPEQAAIMRVQENRVDMGEAEWSGWLDGWLAEPVTMEEIRQD